MRRIISALLLIVVCLSLAACSKKNEITGSWAYNYDEKTEVLFLGKNGEAKYHGKDYKYSADDSFITFTSQDGEELKIRYSLRDDDFYIFEKTEYESKGSHEGIIGKWINNEKKWSFEFTKDGEFVEDGYFTGFYSLNDSDSSFTLDYYDDFDKTTCYYAISEDTLSVEYPWEMKETEKQ